jgi:hypothetical protein
MMVYCGILHHDSDIILVLVRLVNVIPDIDPKLKYVVAVEIEAGKEFE